MFSTDRLEVPIRETEAKHVFDAFDTSEDKSMHFGRKRSLINIVRWASARAASFIELFLWPSRASAPPTRKPQAATR